MNVYRFHDTLMKVKNLTELIQQRWKELEDQGITVYQIAKEYGKLKGDEPGTKRYNNYVSTVKKAIDDPLSVKTETLELVKKAMGIETSYTITEIKKVVFSA